MKKKNEIKTRKRREIQRRERMRERKVCTCVIANKKKKRTTTSDKKEGERTKTRRGKRKDTRRQWIGFGLLSWRRRRRGPAGDAVVGDPNWRAKSKALL